MQLGGYHCGSIPMGRMIHHDQVVDVEKDDDPI
jgi:hypothetical protein